jgi:hypothetical protein
MTDAPRPEVLLTQHRIANRLGLRLGVLATSPADEATP